MPEVISIFFFDGPAHGWAEAIERLGCPDAGTRSRHRHPQNDVELGAALAKAALIYETNKQTRETAA